MESKARLIVVGSAAERREMLALTMRASGIFEVVEAASAFETIARVSEGVFAGAVCAWPLKEPQGGLELLRFLRHNNQNVMIAVVGVRVEEWASREILRAGADLYFPSSSDLDLVAAHMEMGVLRLSVPTSEFHIGDLTVDISAHQVSRGDAMVPLTPIEFRLLKSLVEHVGGVVSKGQLFEACWRRHDDPHGEAAHLVEVHVSQLRKKLHACGPPILHTIHGVGYVLRPSTL